MSNYVLRLHSPDQSIIQGLDGFAKTKLVMVSHFADGRSEDNSGQNYGPQILMGGGLKFQHDWIYKWEIRPDPLSRTAMKRQWRHFERNVDRLAA